MRASLVVFTIVLVLPDELVGLLGGEGAGPRELVIQWVSFISLASRKLRNACRH